MLGKIPLAGLANRRGKWPRNRHPPKVTGTMHNAENTAPTVAHAPNAASVAAQLLALAQQAPNADTRTPAQVAADNAGPNATPGLQTGVAGTPATEPLWAYPGAAVVAGRAYRGNAATLYNGLRAIVAATNAGQGAPATYQAVAAAGKALGWRATQHACWVATRDLADLGLLAPAGVGNRKGHQPTAAGLAHLAAVLAATQQAGKAVWVCVHSGAWVCAATGADVAQPAPAVAPTEPETQAPTDAAPAAEPETPAKPGKPGKPGKAK